jgi:hypothetical protein
MASFDSRILDFFFEQGPKIYSFRLFVIFVWVLSFQAQGRSRPYPHSASPVMSWGLYWQTLLRDDDDDDDDDDDGDDDDDDDDDEDDVGDDDGLPPARKAGAHTRPLLTST